MPYVDRDGRVVQKQPWDMKRIVGMFWAFVAFFTMFFRNLFGENINRRGSSYTSDYRGGGGPPKPPSNNRISGFRNPGTAPGGGCANGQCGR